MDRAAFYAALRTKAPTLFGGRLSADAVRGMEGIIDAFDDVGDGFRHAASLNARETARRMQNLRDVAQSPFQTGVGGVQQVQYGALDYAVAHGMNGDAASRTAAFSFGVAELFLKLVSVLLQRALDFGQNLKRRGVNFLHFGSDVRPGSARNVGTNIAPGAK